MDLDLMNACVYAENRATEFMYNKFINSHPHIFKHVTFEKRPATHKDYFVPKSIADKCFVTTAAFTETGCQKIACFPKMQNLEDCDPLDESRYVSVGSKFHLACQPACTQISKQLDTEFRGGKCMMINTNKKAFAMFPESFEGSESPLHRGLDLVNGNLALNERYCGYYGLNFQKGECVMAPGQELAEFIISESAYKSIRRKHAAANIPAPPAVPECMKNVKNWLKDHLVVANKNTFENKSSVGENDPHRSSVDDNIQHKISAKKRKKRSMIGDQPNENKNSVNKRIKGISRWVGDQPNENLENDIDRVQASFNSIPDIDPLDDVAKSIAVDLTIDVALHEIKKSLGKRIPTVLLKSASTRVSKRLMVNMIQKAAMNSAIQTIKVAASAVSFVGIGYCIYSLVGMILDIADPFNFSRVLDKKTVDHLNRRLDFEFFESFVSDVEVDPSVVWNILEEDESELFSHAEEWAKEYLEALDDTEKKELLVPKRQDMITNNDDIFNLVSWCLILLAFVFVEEIALICLVFMMLVIVFPPLGH